jgi:hypothetical protein
MDLIKELTQLNEGARMERLKRSWSILPAGRAVFSKNKVKLQDIMKEWKEGTVLVCAKGSAESMLFLSSAGKMDYPLGTRHDAHHDQSWANIGPLTVINVIHYKNGGKEESDWNAENKNGIDKALPLYVFK